MKSISARICALFPALLLFGGAPSALAAPAEPMSISEAPWRFNVDIFTPKVVLRVEGDYGGFSVDDMDKTYQAIGALGYHFN